MVVCKYFMEGYCRFGSQCRYEHVNPYRNNYEQRRSDYDRPFGTSVLKASITSSSSQQFGQQNVQGPQQTKPSGSVAQRFNIHELMQVVSKDIVLAEKGSQWLLSCYSPFKDLNNIPELEDYSPEELRWEYYIAVLNGRLPVCQAIVQQLHTNVAKVNNKLKKKDTAYSVIEKWLREGEAAQSHHEVSSVGSNSSIDAFSMNSSTSQMSIPSNTHSSEVSFSFSLPQQPTSPMLQPPPMSSLMQQPVAMQQQQMFVGFQQQPASGGIFGGNQMKEQSTFTNIEDNSAYSMVEELSQSELEAFRGRFVFGSIPTKPPPRDMCG